MVYGGNKQKLGGVNEKLKKEAMENEGKRKRRE